MNDNVKTCVVEDLFDKNLEIVCSNKSQYVGKPERDFTRKPELTMRMVMTFVITIGSGSTKNMMDDFFDAQTLPDRDPGDSPYQGSMTKARKKVDPEAFRFMFRRLSRDLQMQLPGQTIRRIAFDGTNLVYDSTDKLSSPNYILNRKEGTSGVLCEQRVTAAYDAASDLYVDAIVSGVHDASEPSDMCAMVDEMKPLDGEKLLYLADRNFCSYNCLAHLQESGQYFIVRGKDITSNGIAGGLGLPDEAFDKWITIDVGRSVPFNRELPDGCYERNIAANQPFDYLDPQSFKKFTLRLRVVRFLLPSGEWELLFSNLDDSFSTEDHKTEYFGRWGEEVAFRSLKYTIGAMSFHSRLDALATQEIFSKLIMFDVASAEAELAGAEMISAEARQPDQLQNYSGLTSAAVELGTAGSELTVSTTGSGASPSEPMASTAEPTLETEESCYLLNYSCAAHIARKNLISRRLSWEVMARRMTRYKSKVEPNRHKPRPKRPRRRFYLNYRAA